MRLSRTDFVELRKNEEDLWRTEVRFSREKMDSLLDDALWDMEKALKRWIKKNGYASNGKKRIVRKTHSR